MRGLILCLALAGCAGIPDAVQIPKPKPCEKIVIVQPENRAHCMTKEEFEKWIRRNLPGSW